ncbi:unnamed protein product [Phaeothamnion confervicola]
MEFLVLLPVVILFSALYAGWAILFWLIGYRCTRAVKAVLTVCTCIVLGLWMSRMVHPKSGGQLTACKSNLKNTATACEMYASDNHGTYPAKLEALTPNYLRMVPQCPSGGDSYAYARSFYAPDVAASVDAYTIVCKGLNHNEAGVQEANYPQFTSYAGLVMPEAK